MIIAKIASQDLISKILNFACRHCLLHSRAARAVGYLWGARSPRCLMRCITSAIILALIASTSFAAMRPTEEQIKGLVESRSSAFYIEGMALDELVIGARAKVTAIFVDRLMGEAMRALSASNGSMPGADLPRFMNNYTGHYADRKGHTLFVIGVDAFKHIDLDTAKLTIAGRETSNDDVLTGVLGMPDYEIRPGVTELPPGWSGLFGVWVPTELVKPGSTFDISYDGYTASMTAPTERR